MSAEQLAGLAKLPSIAYLRGAMAALTGAGMRSFNGSDIMTARQLIGQALDQLDPKGPRYTIVDRPNGTAITCHRCGLTSFSAKDVQERFCGHCRVFHDDVTR